jgi:hypothetical protein
VWRGVHAMQRLAQIWNNQAGFGEKRLYCSTGGIIGLCYRFSGYF